MPAVTELIYHIQKILTPILKKMGCRCPIFGLGKVL